MSAVNSTGDLLNLMSTPFKLVQKSRPLYTIALSDTKILCTLPKR